MTNVSIRQFVILCLIFPLWGLGGLLAQATAQTDTARISSQSVISPPSGEPTVFRPQGEKLGGFAIGASADMKNSTSEDLGGFRAPMAYAPNADITYNKIFGGSGDDYANSRGVFDSRDIKLATDGTIWICGSTQSDDGDLSSAGNHGGIDAWLLHINPKTNQILYNRCFGGSNFDEFCSMLLMPDNTIWVCGSTNSSNGDLTGVTVKGNYDGWVLHIDPSQTTTAAQILYNRCIGGSGNDYFYYIAKNNNIIYLCGETLSAFGDNTGNGFHGGDSDAWLVGLDSTQNASAALTYNRCFGGAKADGFFSMQLIPDGTIWAIGLTRSTDGDIATALAGNHGAAGTSDAWIVHIDPSAAVGSQLKYNCCFGGSSEEEFSDIKVLSNDTIWLCGESNSTSGTLTGAVNHGNTDVWLICVDPTAAPASQIKYNRCFGGSAADAEYSSTRMQLAADGTIWVAAQSASTDGDLAAAGNHGGKDTWLFNLDPAANQLKYNKCFGGSADEIMPAIALDETKKQVWVVCGTSSTNDGDVPATHGGRDLWLFSINYGTTGIESITNDELRIYPNPVKDYLRFTNYELRFNKVEILDLSGKTLMSQSSNLSPINVTNLPAGIYFVKITTDNGIITRKFIKE